MAIGTTHGVHVHNCHSCFFCSCSFSPWFIVIIHVVVHVPFALSFQLLLILLVVAHAPCTLGP